ncbi:thioredoxin family protein [Bacillus sp. H-16]|uniref:thioredoxin family protein n=1 Tax=Alteribacter salitolerans TaxID=2912333 RepID=UPI001964878F|nr:thioredoxin family protein [Alteribacter salitolerans]MBM7095059.1 thioredoxin family protein [Alteribacter salitolerans]
MEKVMVLEKITSYEEAEGVVRDGDPVLVLVKSRRCSVCDAVEVQLLEWREKNRQVRIRSLQMEDVPEAAGQWTVFAAPTLVFFHNGSEVWRGSRFIRWEELDRVTEALGLVRGPDMGYNGG